MSKAGLMLVAALAVSGGVAPSDRGDGGWAADTVDAIAYIRRSLHDYPIVGLAEGGHAALEPHEFLRRVLTDEGVLRAVDVVIVEFATAREQPVLDAYIDGADISFDELSGVWRNTSTSPVAPWDSPLYRELLAAIRNANQALPRPQRVRVLAGDPPIDWERIETRDDFGRAIQPRDLYVAQVAIEQAFGLGKKVLIVFGGAHLPKVPVGGEDDGRNSLTYRILQRHPGGMRVVGFLNPENLGVTDRIDELAAGKAYDTAEHWVGEIAAERFFPGIRSRVTDPETGAVSWEEIPLYSEYRVRDLFDALVYIGPSSEWHVVPPSLDVERDEAYLRELDRRSVIRFGQSRRTME